MSKKMELKNVGFEIKEVKESGNIGTIVGYPSVFGVCDLGDDIIERGAFKKTIKDKKGVWPILVQHDPGRRIGYNASALEDDYGLLCTEKISLDNRDGRDAYALTKLAHDVGGVDGLSIGFSTIKADPDKDRPAVRRIKEVSMWEHSHVTFGMNQDAMTEAVKSWKMENPELGLGDFTDKFFKHMEFLGFDFKAVTEALRKYEAAKMSKDPGAIIQSIDNAISVLRGA